MTQPFQALMKSPAYITWLMAVTQLDQALHIVRMLSKHISRTTPLDKY